MAIVFGVRGDSLDARYSNGGKKGMAFGNTAPAVAADAGAISGNSIQFAANANNKIVSWPGRYNTPNGRNYSILVRFRPNYSGSPASNAPIFHLGTAGGTKVNTLELYHSTAGTLLVHARNELGTNCMNSVSAGSWSPTSGTWYDIVLTWDGTTSASSCKVYVDAALIGSITPAAAFTSSWTNEYFSNISIGVTVNAISVLNGGRIDEVVIWDTVIDPTGNVTLNSGAGLLNGASRTSLVSVSAFDGSSYTDPGVANVGSTTTYTFAGVSQTGTYVKPAASDVRFGVNVGTTTGTAYIPTAANTRSGINVDNTTGTLVVPSLANTKTGVAGDGGTGTYDGSDRWSDPGISHVESGISYKANSTTNNRTGTFVGGGSTVVVKATSVGRRGGGISL